MVLLPQTMNTIILIWIIIAAISIALGTLENFAIYHPKGRVHYALEIWRLSLGYFITAAIGYFLWAVRWPHINSDGVLSIGDFVLGAIFLMGLTGWLPHIIKNISEGIASVLALFAKK
jgi:hypothetical protein